ncbi:hypothetical protein [Streptomyces sp. NPDC088925]|uniref:hypothetical protein n=1 Tax=Streptomyces sp. NPDC088925 TaxID=3365914 RepID=UPI003813209A
MQYNDALIVDDFGPAFLGHVFRVNDGIVCVVPRQPTNRTQAAQAMRRMVGQAGGKCGDCRGCPFMEQAG